MNIQEMYFQEPIDRVLDKVSLFGDRFIVRNKEGEAVAAMVPIEDLDTLQQLES